jgi:hypothetical protein
MIEKETPGVTKSAKSVQGFSKENPYQNYVVSPNHALILVCSQVEPIYSHLQVEVPLDGLGCTEKLMQSMQ